jgi:glutathione synthase/RimK-type ligase-like ATP-grasp enzyme
MTTKLVLLLSQEGDAHILPVQAAIGQARFIYTNQIQPEHLDKLDGVRATAHLFQEYIEKTLELRVVIIGRQLFAVEIYSQLAKQSSVDWRRDYSVLRYGVHQLSTDIEQKLFQLVQLFGLQYSSMDLIISPQGEYIWLELNACGQFGWLEPPTGLAMSEAMANLLMNPEECGLW